MTELLVISAAGSLSVRPLPITFFRPISAHKQEQAEQAMCGVVFNGECELESMPFPDPMPNAHDVVIEMRASRNLAPIISGFRVCALRIPE